MIMEKGCLGMKIRAGGCRRFWWRYFPPRPGGPGGVPAQATIRGACDVAFLITSTLHDVPGSARCLPFAAALARDAAGRQVIPSVEWKCRWRGWTRGTGRATGRCGRCSGRSGSADTAAAQNVDVERLRAETGKGRGGDASIDLLLRIRDVERKVRATASNLKESGGRVTFDLEFPVSLGELELKAPSVLGIVRVGDKVSVKANFTLTVIRSP